MPSPLRRRAVRLLSRWQAGRRSGPRTPIVALATALAMVGALILEPGIVARTPDLTTSLAATTAGFAVPTTHLDRLDRIPELERRGAAAYGQAPGIASPDVAFDAFLRAPNFDPVAFIEWMARYAALAEADRAAMTTAGSSPGVDSVTLGRPSVGAAASTPSTRRAHRAAKPAKPAPRPPTLAPRPTNRGSGPDGTWNVAPIVTWYGPGFYGNRTACGVRYTRTIIGVAHRTLPCGTLIEFRWHGITAVAPVIDRGPYASSAYVFDWSAALSCRVFKPQGVSNSCYTRFDVQWRIVGRRRL